LSLKAPADPLPRLRERGVYLVTGGLGGIGLCIADYLAQAVRARLILVGRSALPPQDEWDAYLASHEAPDRTARRILAVRALIAKGANVRVEAADVADRGQMTAVMQRIREHFGALHGVIHAAGIPGGGLIQLKTREAADAVLRPKVAGTRVLAALLGESQPDFMLLCSSINALVGAPGQVDYTAANAYLDAFALTQRRRAGTYTVSVNWDTWREVGMAVEAAVPGALAARRDANLGIGIGNAEGVEAFRRVLASALPQVVVSPRVMERASAVVSTPEADADIAGSVYERPDLDVDYVAPRDEIEQKIARMWSEYLGIARIGVQDDFLDLGGHSLLATRLLGRLRDELGVDHLTLEDILAEPTVAGIARRIRDRDLSSGRMRSAPEPAAGAAAESQTTSRGSASDLLARVYAASKGKSLTGQ
jgi:NAD(P)-dependent dehydrogenase (short-subunit alcohol dehydrogenase family)